MVNIIYKACNLPVFQNVLYDTMEEALNCKVGDIELIQDENTGLIYNRLFNPDIMEYNKDYSFDPSFSQAYRNIVSGIKDIIEKHMGKNKLLEIGCGKGYFVDYLSSCGFDIIGMDPAYEGNNPNIKKEYYNKDSQKSLSQL